MVLGKVAWIKIGVALALAAVLGAVAYGSLAHQPEGSSDYYVDRPTFYNLPAVVYSNSSYTEQVREHISYCTFEYDLTDNVSHIVSAPIDVPIIVDGYSTDLCNGALVEACSQALLNGSIVVALWEHAGDFMMQVFTVSYGRDHGGYGDEAPSVVGFWGSNGFQPSEYLVIENLDVSDPSMTTLTQTYEWSIRTVHDQPFHPTLYP